MHSPDNDIADLTLSVTTNDLDCVGDIDSVSGAHDAFLSHVDRLGWPSLRDMNTKSTTVTVVLSIDGLAPRHITRATMPYLTTLARTGASCFSARTVLPTITLPAHTSMFRSVAPAAHGLLDNTPGPVSTDAPSFLQQAHASGQRTAAFLSWLPLDACLESTAVTELVLTDAGYGPHDDANTTNSACALLDRRDHDIVFVYLTQPDVDGHRYGWDSPEYVAAATRSDALLGQLLQHVGPDDRVVVTTDHGGIAKSHGGDRPEETETFVVLRAGGRVAPATGWATASILDIAPTVADLCGFDPAPQWQGRSLVGHELPLVDTLIELLQLTGHQSYGENVNMLDHSLQSAAKARSVGASDDLILAALLHDLGHVLGQAGDWGLPGHAELGARALQPLLSAAITEPIRNHVAAKRYRVATEPSYLDRLSHASIMSLEEQGGPFSDDEVRRFEANPFCAEAVALREFDDDGKVEGIEIAGLESYRPMIQAALAAVGPTSATWARDACRCAECRDAGNDQHLLDVQDLDGWTVVGESSTETDRPITVQHTDGRRHACVVPAGSATGRVDRRLWEGTHSKTLRTNATDARGDLSTFAEALALDGIALATNVDTTPDEVLRFADRIGFVRNTNYGELFDVIAAANPNNLAFTPVGLPLHTDNPYRDPCPTVQLLHCLASAETGGASQFADGFAVAEHLRRSFAADFAVLTQTVVDFRFHDDEVDLRARRPLIELSADGQVVAVAVNHRSMEAPTGAVAMVERFYAAYARFATELSSPRFVLGITLGPGDLIAFDNRRVLHGREAFAEVAARHLQGCYIDIDAVQSAQRLAITG